MTVKEVAQAVSAENDVSQYGDQMVTSAAFDSRRLKPGALFVPLTDKRDGHKFLPSARKNGAAASFWAADHPNPPKDFPVIVVKDPFKALQKLAHYYREKVNPKVVAITGSNGKTTTKDLTASVLATQYRVVKTHASFNNAIGVPVTILSMNPDTQILVVEMGMDNYGQLDRHSKIAEPDVALITMIGEAHIGNLGSRAGIANAKMEITHGLKADGTFMFNGDEPLLQSRAKKVSQKQLTFGDQASNDLYPTQIKGYNTKTEFTVNKYPNQKFTIPILGDYNVNNACGALLIASLFRITPQNMKKGLMNAPLTQNRTEWLTGIKGEPVLSDVYNSNPSAARAVLKTFSATHTNGKRIAVLGDMLELGKNSKAMHASLAKDLDPKKIQSVYLIGTDMDALEAALKGKYPAGAVHYYRADQLAQLTRDLENEFTSKDEVMLKASHGIHLEKVLAKITK
ncbi:MAG: UDP-N-acetylmuramoyl-tripeptide--D-alanyl-D- alanine ligase [Acetilactobacillus jinshanensis]